MKKSIILLIIVLILLFNLKGTFPKLKTIPMPLLVNPEAFAIDNQQIYIVEKTQISIYNLLTLELVKKFGKRGEGPGEFIPNPQTGQPMFIDVQGNQITITSLGKISFFSKNGKYLGEKRSPNGSGDDFQPLGEGFVGQTIQPEGNQLMRAITRFDNQLQPLHTLIKVKHHFQAGRGFEVLREPMTYLTDKDKLFVTWDADFKVTIYNSTGKLKSAIIRPYQRLKVTKADQKQIIEFLKTHPTFKQFYEILRPIKFPTHFPAIQQMRLADGLIYLLTFRKKSEKTECFIYNHIGEEIKKVWVPFIKLNPLEDYPFAFKNNKLYQLVENQEKWELQISDL